MKHRCWIVKSHPASLPPVLLLTQPSIGSTLCEVISPSLGDPLHKAVCSALFQVTLGLVFIIDVFLPSASHFLFIRWQSKPWNISPRGNILNKLTPQKAGKTPTMERRGGKNKQTTFRITLNLFSFNLYSTQVDIDMGWGGIQIRPVHAIRCLVPVQRCYIISSESTCMTRTHAIIWKY